MQERGRSWRGFQRLAIIGELRGLAMPAIKPTSAGRPGEKRVYVYFLGCAKAATSPDMKIVDEWD
jgi:hypothetical protein